MLQSHHLTRRDFNPRSLHGERPPSSPLQQRRSTNFNPRSLHGERPYIDKLVNSKEMISIHAPCTGSDDYVATGEDVEPEDFNPRSLHGERRAQCY